MQRGQFFSADFVIAVVAVSFALGVLLHAGQLALDGLGRYALHDDSVAKTVADGLAMEPAVGFDAATISNTCWEYDNGTQSSPPCYNAANGVIDGPSGCVAKEREIFAARRIVPCRSAVEPQVCLLTVRSCERTLE